MCVSASASNIIPPAVPLTSTLLSLIKTLSIVTPDPEVVSEIVLAAIVLPDKAVKVLAVNLKSSAPAIAISI